MNPGFGWGFCFLGALGGASTSSSGVGRYWGRPLIELVLDVPRGGVPGSIPAIWGCGGCAVSRWLLTFLQGWHWVPRLASMMALSASSVMPSWLKSYQLEAPPPWLGSAQ